MVGCVRSRCATISFSFISPVCKSDRIRWRVSSAIAFTKSLTSQHIVLMGPLLSKLAIPVLAWPGFGANELQHFTPLFGSRAGERLSSHTLCTHQFFDSSSRPARSQGRSPSADHLSYQPALDAVRAADWRKHPARRCKWVRQGLAFSRPSVSPYSVMGLSLSPPARQDSRHKEG